MIMMKSKLWYYNILWVMVLAHKSHGLHFVLYVVGKVFKTF